MQKYWYYGVRMQQLCVDVTGRTQNVQVVRWHDEVYATKEEAAHACAPKMASHPGVSYFIQCFDRELNIVDGESKGYKTAQ